MISFGPFITRKGEARLIEPGLLYCGFALEFISQAASADVPIFRQVLTNQERILFADYRVQATDIFTVLEDTYERIGEPPLGTYIPLKTFLVGLYKEHKPFRPFPEFLTEFRQHLPFLDDSVQLGP